ncbi:hypothetical protein NQZ68_018730 [Dissostichus eleginoides]|nr:hypothetical protein NQZ68_018730 [Dissostichus eleginoides]
MAVTGVSWDLLFLYSKSLKTAPAGFDGVAQQQTSQTAKKEFTAISTAKPGGAMLSDKTHGHIVFT